MCLLLYKRASIFLAKQCLYLQYFTNKFYVYSMVVNRIPWLENSGVNVSIFEKFQLK